MVILPFLASGLVTVISYVIEEAVILTKLGCLLLFSVLAPLAFASSYNFLGMDFESANPTLILSEII